jgi:multiple sugar transport system ATP-binding protein
VRGPKLLLLDDPLRNVDAKLRYEMRIELPRLLKRTDATVLYVTQDYKEAMALGDRIAVLDGNRFIQIDTPADIYRKPACTKVARLLGDPTINLKPARLSADGDRVSVELFGQTLPLKVKPDGAAECVVGIRPEHIKVSMTATERGLPAELDAVTPLNVRSVLLLKTKDGGELLASCSEAEAARLPRGHGAVWLDLSPDDLLLFDAETGERLSGATP